MSGKKNTTEKGPGSAGVVQTAKAGPGPDAPRPEREAELAEEAKPEVKPEVKPERMAPQYAERSIPVAEPIRFKCLCAKVQVRDRIGRIVCQASLGDVKLIHPGTDLYAICLANPDQWERCDAPTQFTPLMAKAFKPTSK